MSFLTNPTDGVFTTSPGMRGLVGTGTRSKKAKILLNNKLHNSCCEGRSL